LIPTDLEIDEDARRFFCFLRIWAPLEVLLVAVKATEVHRTNYNTPEHHQASEKATRLTASRSGRLRRCGRHCDTGARRIC
jgi:hypothetical protein